MLPHEIISCSFLRQSIPTVFKVPDRNRGALPLVLGSATLRGSGLGNEITLLPRTKRGAAEGSHLTSLWHKMYLIIPAAPLLASAVAGLAGRYVGPTGASLITTSCLYFSLFLSCICFYEVGLCGSPCHIHALE